MTDWHDMSGPQACAKLQTDPRQGLSTADAEQRQRVHGANCLRESPPRPAWQRFVDQFRGLLVLILLLAAGVALALGDTTDAVVIVSVVIINATLGFVQEHRAEAALAMLRGMLSPTARVRRDGIDRQIAARDLVPGDILLLEAGDRIPADGRVLQAHGAELAEAALTGESQPVSKQATSVASSTVLAERHNMVYMNTVMTRGRLEAVVTATGMTSEMGRLATLLEQGTAVPTPLQHQLDALGKRLALIAGVVVGMLFLLGLARGDDLYTTTMTAIALAVAAIPEGLPAVVTVTLALGMRRMARRQAIVKKLAAVETLGCTSVICSDKTGTLTLNQMTVRALYVLGTDIQVSGHGYDGTGTLSPSPLPPAQLHHCLQPAALCIDAQLVAGELIGDPTEGALLALCRHAGLDVAALQAAQPRCAEIPFDTAYKFMATFHHQGDHVDMWIKGAPDVLLARASHWQTVNGIAPLDEAARTTCAAHNDAFADQALRVLALAHRRIPADQFATQGDLLGWCQELTLLALVGIIDPPRPEAATAIQACQQAGIAVKMITGDHPATAQAIARALGLPGDVCTGADLDRLTADDWPAVVRRCGVFARVAPEHKMRIVATLQAAGHVVAMTGDGVNDAPALKAADIGIAMGQTGTAVTQEAATLVLTDDNFATIVSAIEEGRSIYDNIVKFVRFQLSTNIGAILTVLGAPLCGFATPFTAVQILWVNIIMDGPPAMTLGVEPARSGLMHQPPRQADSQILSASRLWRIGLYGLTMACATLGMYGWGLLTHGDEAVARTLAFTTFVLCQFFNIFNARAEHGSAFNPQFFANRSLWLALAGVVGLQIVAVHWAPAQIIFSTVDLGWHEWLLAGLSAASVLLLDETRKLGLRLLQRNKTGH